jgi:hypothetical protein
MPIPLGAAAENLTRRQHEQTSELNLVHVRPVSIGPMYAPGSRLAHWPPCRAAKLRAHRARMPAVHAVEWNLLAAFRRIRPQRCWQLLSHLHLR